MEIINQTSFQPAMIVGRVNFPEYSLTLIVKGTFDLVHNETAVISEDQFFPTGDTPYPDDDDGNGSCKYESDFAYYKPRTDLLLTGKCCVPGGKQLQGCRVSFQVGNQSKTLAVFGDRYWHRLSETISDPEPFTELELRYENSYGGNGYQKNPVGKGFTESHDSDGSKVWPLPNIEHLEDLIDSQGKQPEPVGFGPIGNMWYQRYSKLGSYGEDWLSQRWPWFPGDFSWDYFNAAQRNMQVDNYLGGKESMFFENLHREISQYRCKLPGLKVRCFLDHDISQIRGANHLKEVVMNLDTLWVDMEEEKLVLVWRGVTDVQTENYHEIKHLFVVSEQLGGPVRSVDMYYEDLKKALVADEIPFEEEMEVNDIAEPFFSIEEEMQKTELEIRKAKEDLRNELLAAGIDPDVEIPELNKNDRGLESNLIRQYTVDPTELKRKLTRESLVKGIANGESFAEEDFSDFDLSNLNFSSGDFTGAIFRNANLKNTVFDGAILNGTYFESANLSGASLKKVTADDADFTNAQMSGANFSGSKMKDAIFEAADLDNSNFDNTDILDGYFSKANLSSASFKNGLFDGADFSKTILDHTDFSGASLREASLEGACGEGLLMMECDLTELRASEGCSFVNGNFKNIIGVESIWEHAELTGADFSTSEMVGADFTSATLKRVNFRGAKMNNVRFLHANLTSADFINVNLFESSFEKSDLTETDFSGSNLYGTEFLEATLDKTGFNYANLKMTKLARREKSRDGCISNR
ncbi:MAG: DUF2169 domain-containing protein [Desulfobulbaceae bacterium]|nr:DUF2169 domain-containing protein [Desulfobulbaceae bacterium]